MNIIIVTPTSSKSAIAKISTIIEKYVSKDHCRVTLICSEIGKLAVRNGVYIHYSQTKIVEEILRESDIIIYQIGDNYAFHAGALFWMIKHPGIVCVHDYDLTNLLNGLRNDKNRVAHSMLGETQYSLDVEHNTQSFAERLSQLALGVFTHSAWGISPLAAVCSGPIWIFPLCHPKSVPDLEMEDKRSLDERNPRLRILTIGHINPNKRVDQIINAIGLRKELRDNVSYHVVGPIESVLLESYRRRVAELAIDVMFFGEVPDEVLDREIRNADVVVALRWPPLVAGSASVVEALWHGKPTIVTDVGCFRDLPDDVVVKVAPDDVDQLCAALMLLVDNRDRRAKLSARARAFATSEFSPERYAENVRKFCEVVLKKSFAMSAAVSMVRQLGRWGIPQDAGALKLLAEKWDVFT